MNNLFENLPRQLPNELVEVLAKNQSIRIERIVSTGHQSPENFWYEQSEREWVAVLQGRARILFADDGSSVCLEPGDYVDIPAGRKHRVTWTTPEEPTVWLAVFFAEDEEHRFGEE